MVEIHAETYHTGASTVCSGGACVLPLRRLEALRVRHASGGCRVCRVVRVRMSHTSRCATSSTAVSMLHTRSSGRCRHALLMCWRGANTWWCGGVAGRKLRVRDRGGEGSGLG